MSQPGSTKTVTELFSEDIQRKENQVEEAFYIDTVEGSPSYHISPQIAQLTKTWAGKWEGYQNIIEVCVLTTYNKLMCVLCIIFQDSNLALHSEGIKMTVASELPHFLAVDDDALGTGVVIYHLQVCTHLLSLVSPNTCIYINYVSPCLPVLYRSLFSTCSMSIQV